MAHKMFSLMMIAARPELNCPNIYIYIYTLHMYICMRKFTENDEKKQQRQQQQQRTQEENNIKKGSKCRTQSKSRRKEKKKKNLPERECEREGERREEKKLKQKTVQQLSERKHRVFGGLFDHECFRICAKELTCLPINIKGKMPQLTYVVRRLCCSLSFYRILLNTRTRACVYVCMCV